MHIDWRRETLCAQWLDEGNFVCPMTGEGKFSCVLIDSTPFQMKIPGYPGGYRVFPIILCLCSYAFSHVLNALLSSLFRYPEHHEDYRYFMMIFGLFWPLLVL